MTVTSAKFRLATPEEVYNKKGNCLSAALSKPWQLFNQAWGTYNMWRGGTNVLAWDTPWPLKMAHAVTQAPHHAFVKEIPSFLFKTVMLTDKTVSEAYLAHHRNGELLMPNRSFMQLYAMAKQTFPDMNLDTEDVIFTCSEENSKIFRSMFSGVMHGNEMKDAIREEVEAALKRWAQECSGGIFINVTEKTRILASNIITRVVLGQKVDNQNLCDAINYINAYTLKVLTKIATEEDHAEYKRSLAIFRGETENILKSGSEIPLLKDRALSPAQQRALIFVTFFAGQETVASLLNNTLYEIGKDPKQAQRLEQDSLDDFYIRSIHDFTPAYGTGRKSKESVTLEYTLSNGKSGKTVFLKDTYVAARMSAIAESIQLPEEGPLDDFKRLDWKPFGAGPHVCPGRVLAEFEFKEFFDAVKAGYTVTLMPKHPVPKRVGHVSLQLTEDIFINIKKKEE